MDKASVLNFNIGVLGHVDSGKTSLSKVLSTVASTASFDKNPQSRERGITLDLGFSSFAVDVAEFKQDVLKGYKTVQYTLVDCPGHASLIRTIIGGAQIIDLMLLVLDITKGMQTQTAECLVIGEITCSKMIVVLNKLDMISPDKQSSAVDKLKKRMWKTLETTKFANCPIVAVAAKPGGPEATETEAVGIQDLISAIQNNTYLPSRSEEGPFIFSVDHCFSIRGQGTVMTGTVLSGKVCVNDTVEIPSLGLSKKVKSIQMFHTPFEKIRQGDRAGICVTQFDPTLLERGLVCSPGTLVTAEAVIISINKVIYYKGPVSTKGKFHITLGHETVMGRISIFGSPPEKNNEQQESDITAASQCLDSLHLATETFDYTKDYIYQDELFSSNNKTGTGDSSCKEGKVGKQFALIELDHAVTCAPHSIVIGSRLDADVHTSACRIAFSGKIMDAISDIKYKETVLPKLKVFKVKTKEGQIERAMDQYTIIAKNLFKKETNIAAFANLKVVLSSGERGMIEGGFGQSGKVKIRIPDGLTTDTFQRYTTKKKSKGKEDSASNVEDSAVSDNKEPVKIYIHFKRYVYDPNKKMVQSG
ncbi:unnamed protein product [Candidula unifasciata]|uniref:Selenocysteine-specific elongation factor n=1 Tax=Candidula unifasciata TaxID=100452 RepID=A0A8S3ZKC1_9EUPU|nr:unnamed protein product [Candidula unifasciata]